MTSEYIYQVLRGKYHWRQNRYVVENCFVFDNWELDFFVVTKAGLGVEYEVKVSRSDFFADMKKEAKHLTLSTRRMYGTYQEREGKRLVKKIRELDIPIKMPNRFYYVVPMDLIKLEEIPEYAGLMYVSNYQLIEVKKAPMLHKEKLDYKMFLTDKFYYYWQKSISELKWKSIEIDTLKRNVEALKNKLTSKVV